MRSSTLMKRINLAPMLALPALAMALLACSPANNNSATTNDTVQPITAVSGAEARFDIYQPVIMDVDLSHLSAQQLQLVGTLIEASELMDDLFWQQAFAGDKTTFLARVTEPHARRFAEI